MCRLSIFTWNTLFIGTSVPERKKICVSGCLQKLKNGKITNSSSLKFLFWDQLFTHIWNTQNKSITSVFCCFNLKSNISKLNYFTTMNQLKILLWMVFISLADQHQLFLWWLYTCLFFEKTNKKPTICGWVQLPEMLEIYSNSLTNVKCFTIVPGIVYSAFEKTLTLFFYGLCFSKNSEELKMFTFDLIFLI